MKKIFVAVSAVVVAGTLLFVSCKKDPEISITGSKIMGDLGDEGGGRLYCCAKAF